jgi:hypothetical protein
MLASLVSNYSQMFPSDRLLELFKYVLDECLFEFRYERGGSKCKH